MGRSAVTGTQASPRQLCFFLGGTDLEMREIERLARKAQSRITDNHLLWGARLSDYSTEVDAAQAEGWTCVAVELADDMPSQWPARNHLILIDHHGPKAGGVSSLRQVFNLLELPSACWTRRLALVEANDIGHVAALRAARATEEEIVRIRAEDREAQGVTAEEEEAGRRALAKAEVSANGWTIVRLPHARCATVTDPLATDPRFAHLPANVLVCSPKEVNAFGDGDAMLALDRSFSGGWIGGDLPRRGYWGLRLTGTLKCDDIVQGLGGRGAPPRD